MWKSRELFLRTIQRPILCDARQRFYRFSWDMMNKSKSGGVQLSYTKGTITVSRLWKYRYLYFLLIPGFLFFIIFHYIPMYGLIIAFKDYKPWLGILKSEWVGFEYFIRFVQSPYFTRVLRNSILISFLKILFCFPAPIILALMLNEVRMGWYKKTIQSVSYLPHFLSWVVVYGIMVSMFSVTDGYLNKMIMSLGLAPIPVLSKSRLFRPLIILSSGWKGVGWGSIIYLAAISKIDPALYEVATIDGAGRFRKIWNITLPSIMPIVTIFLIFTIGALMSNDFMQILQFMRTAGQMEMGDVVDTYVYRIGFRQGQYSLGTAVGFFKSIVGVILIVSTNYAVKKTGQEGLW